ncbi:MAG: TonB-dependent receptor, partial [Bacteroidota bacterium]
DILFFQNKLEIKKEGKFFIRAYATNEDAGNSYDAYSTAILLQNAAKADGVWGADYNSMMQSTLGAYLNDVWYPGNSNGKGIQFDTINPPTNRLPAIENHWQTVLFDSLVYFHNLARNQANNVPSANNTGVARFEPGTARFDSAFQSIISRTNREGGSRFFDRSALYHVAGEYQFSLFDIDVKTGGSFRLYAPYSRGTIFLDTGDVRIYNREAGAYLGLERKLFSDKLKVSWTNRVDKNQNFNTLWSTAATGVYTYKKHVWRASVSSAIRNPTLTDQYINLNVGRATLLGNLNGFDSVVTISSLLDAFSKGRTQLSYFNVDPIKPEQVRTFELGWRGSLFKDKLYVDVNYYFSWYTNFIGYKIGARPNWPEGSNVPTRNPEVFRVATNSKDEVTTQGFTGGINYFYKKYLGFAANYSWNVLDRQGSTDPLIPAFNTPEHKYNIGLNGRDFDINFGAFRSKWWGYGINYKYQTGFMFEGSPQFTGEVPAYYMLDVQINKRIPGWYCTFKLGSNNITDNRVIQVYGGPQVGRLAYFSVLFELDGNR